MKIENVNQTMIINRVWAMPNPCTFSIKPIEELLKRHLKDHEIVVDPFARDSQVGFYRNDLNPNTKANWHMHAEEFCLMLADNSIYADAVLFDPPYSPRQISEVYAAVGIKATTKDTQNASLYKSVRDGLDTILKPGGIAISCGWNSAGFGKERGYKIIEIMLVAHGGAHNDTIVTVEQKG